MIESKGALISPLKLYPKIASTINAYESNSACSGSLSINSILAYSHWSTKC